MKRIATSLLLACLAPLPARAATILYSNDVLGELEPCGCRSNPLGGMVRKQGLAETLRKQGEKNLVQLDAGDLLFDSADVPGPLERQAKIQARKLLEAHAAIGPLAVTPGEKDFALGVSELQKIVASAKGRAHFVSANLKRGKTLLFPASHVFVAGRGKDAVRIGVIGVTGKELALPRGLSVSDPVAAAKTEAARLRGKVDVLVALSHQGLEADLKLARAVPSLDWVIGGHTQSFLQEPTVIGKTRVAQSSFRNQYVGLIRVPAGKHELVGLEPKYEEMPARETRKIVSALRAEISKLEDDDLAASSRNGGPATFVTCVQCHEKQFDFWRKTNHANALAPLLAQKQLTNLECVRCHSVGFDKTDGFRKTTEIAALKTGPGVDAAFEPLTMEDLAAYLADLHDAKDLDTPIRLKRADAPAPARDTVGRLAHSFAPVQCENCHGPSTGHPFSSAQPTLHKKVLPATCVQCHNAERAPAWYKSGKLDEKLFAEKLKSVSCPSDDAS